MVTEPTLDTAQAVTGDNTTPPGYPSPTLVWEFVSAGRPFEELTALLKPELHGWADDTWREFRLRYIRLETVVGQMYGQIIEVTGPEPAREVFATEAQQCPAAMRRYLMLLFDGIDKTLDQALWQALKPEDSQR